MRPTVSQYAQALEELSEKEAHIKAGDVAKNFFGWLKRRGEEKKLPAIVKQLEKLQKEKEGRLTVTAVTAHEASPHVKKILSEKAEKLFPGKKIELEHTIDKDIIGGAKLKTDEILFDATLKSELNALKKDLLKA